MSLGRINWGKVLKMGRKEILGLDRHSFGDGLITPAEIRHILEKLGALWTHSGDAHAPHTKTRGTDKEPGKHTNGYVDVLRALRHTTICDLFAHQLYTKLTTGTDPMVELGTDDWVVGSDHAAAAFSRAVAGFFRCMHDYPRKEPDNSQTWARFPIEPGQRVCQVEELVTTTATLDRVRKGIQKLSPDAQFTSAVGTLVHRSDTYEFEGTPIVHLIHLDISTWEPSECPLCAGGSPLIEEPKKNWAALTVRK